MPAVYTRTGDKGETGLFGGSRVAKQSQRVEAYGTVDEANAAIGLAKAQARNTRSRDQLHHVQQRLFVLAAELASDEKGAKILDNKVGADDIADLEELIDECLEVTGPQRAFVIPGRDVASGALHYARTVVRRAERQVLTLAESESVRPELITYLNRCSDAVYALARLAEHEWDIQHIREVVTRAVSKVTGTNPQTAPEMSLELAQRFATAARAKAEELGVPIVFAAVDRSGNPVLLERMADSLVASIDIAMNKAWSANAFKMSTAELGQAVREMPGLEAGNDGRVVLFGGGVPLAGGGGGIGVSGGTVAEDLEIVSWAMSTVMGENA